MENLNIILSLRLLLDEYCELTPVLSKYLFEQTWTRDGRQELLNDLSELLLQEKYTVRIAILFTPILLELLNRISDMSGEDSTAKHEWLCICLSKLVWNFPEVGRFTRFYFEKSYNLFCRFEEEGEPAPKKQKTEIMHATPYQLLKAAYLFLIYDAPYFKDLWDWSVVVNFLYGEVEESWYACQCLARVGNIKSSKLSSILQKRFRKEDFIQFFDEEILLASYWNYDLYSPFREDILQSGNFLKLSDSDLSSEVVNVCGILLNRYPDNEVLGGERLVCVPSVIKSLHSLALAVSSGEPVLLQGPVGCGKTSLVEYLARLTGRRPFEDLLKIQLGDHMDSKTLLGTYCCTDVPGEFIWKSGVLVQAMIEGYWLLLEDIDCAPLDVVSLLVPVLQSRTIVLPGHTHPIKAASGFQLFATQRLLSGFGGSYLEFRNNAEIINKQWRKIMIDSFPKQELEKVIVTKWPKLEPVVHQVLEVYSIFSPDITNDHGANNEAFNAYSRHGRLISIRDLFKFCDRITEGFSVSNSETSISIFRNGVECFCDHISCPKTQLSAAESIGIKFNVPRVKAEYFCKKNKPEIEKSGDFVKIGRVYLERKAKDIKTIEIGRKFSFAHTRLASALLEKVAAAVLNDEPVLLVGETGTGKTSVVQYLADLTNKKLTVINMSQQSDSVDLLGGYKPVDLIQVIHPIREAFLELFPLVINTDRNAKFLQHISNCYYKRRYEELLGLMLHAQKNIVDLYEKKYSSSAKHVMMISKWRTLGEKIQRVKQQIKQMKNALAFKFIEGALIKAMKNGEWLLLDEINLAEAETLECLAGILEKDDNTLLLLEKGNKEPVVRHPDFHVFACMNPATDVGKKDLPAGIRSRFTEIFVQEIDDKIDLTILAQMYLRGLSLNPSVIENVVDFYIFIKKAAIEKLNDGTGHHPHYSLRTLCRALKCASSNPCHNVPRSLYEAFCLSFLSQLDNESHPFVTSAIANHLLGKKHLSILKQSIPEPRNGKHVPIQGYWILKGNQEISCPKNYIFTNTVYRNLHDLARIVSAGRYPVLLQGETSVGKTSLVQWLAKATGNVCVRVNNHEHTDIQEYVGTYSADETGRLVFKEGILVEAMRNGYWIILDELNLAPTEVMEALNRVLDDNRELFIAETQTLVKAHSGFMIFATQNPPGLYGGRKLLSRAFRNRFIELHFNEIPPSELEIILEKRCQVPPTYSKKLVAVMQELQVRRRESGVFAGKQGYITLRDLFRWGERYRNFGEQGGTYYDWEQHLAEEGYLLLGGRVRLDEELKVIKEVLEKHFKRILNTKLLFNLSENTSLATKLILKKALETPLSEELRNIVWTYNMRRLAVLVGKALEFQEPVLLVGNTGCGKTTMCQIYAELQDKTLYSVNCHMHSESADFLGGLRPVRDTDKRNSKLFEWVDGPLILAMQEGSHFLADEISLADDSVLERLNSVLEPEQTILLAEKCFDTCQESEIIAEKGFQFFATMNPGGDYGKKELSPALRNRFTEIWCPSNLLTQDIIDIVEHNIKKGIFHPYATEKDSGFGVAIAEFLSFYTKTDIGRWTTISVRDVLTWVDFINICEDNLSPSEAYIHGAFLVFLDAAGSGPTALGSPEIIQDVKQKCFEFLTHQVGKKALIAPELFLPDLYSKPFEKYHVGPCGESESYFGIGPFVIDFDSSQYKEWSSTYVLESSTPKMNALRILRAMQLSKPILLEGSPGVGKTSMVSALAKASGHKLVRINLSEQTDISDLFGADLPVEDGKKGEFAWHDGPLLQALNQGDWILLDELNLASQSVLEGLNACLDHRNEIHIPELGKTFHVRIHVSRIFGCQNPHRQGGARKGLPRSFLNRFTQVYMKPMETSDFEYIATHVFSSISPRLITAMVKFNHELNFNVNEKRLWGQDGYPWEFNLRDIFRWCAAMVTNQNESEYNVGEYMKLIYVDRMRSVADKIQVYKLFDSVMQNCELDKNSLGETVRHLDLNIFDKCVQLGYSFVPRVGQNLSDDKMMSIAHRQLSGLESLMKCIEMKWMAILVGPSGSGKSTLVRLLAALTGNQLHVISVNSEMDTTELLGGFEQADMNRKIEFLIQQLEPVVRQAIFRCIESADNTHINYLRHILHKMDSLARTKQDLHSEQVAQSTNYYQDKLRHLRDLIDTLISSISSSGMKRFLTNFKEEVIELISKLNSSIESIGGQFEWMDSVLVQAVEKGHWVLIDDANFCSPSVLDRLNALLEPNGFLTINEQGAFDGALRDVYPHENFRIILTMNPKNGEISRAMRNRGIEIYLEPVSSNLHEEKDLFDMVALSQCQGLVHSEMIFYLYDIHRRLTDCPEYENPSLSDFISASALCVQLLQKHEDPHICLSKVAELVYANNNFSVTSRQVAVSIIQDMMEKLPRLTVDEGIPITSLLPTSLDYRQNAFLASVRKQGLMIVYFFKHIKDCLKELKRRKDGIIWKPKFSPYPVPEIPPLESVEFEIRKFVCIMRIVFQSCSVEQYKFLDHWLDSKLEDFLKNTLSDDLYRILKSILKFKSVLSTQLGNPVICYIANLVTIILKENKEKNADFIKIKQSEIPIDPRWNFNVYKKLIFLSKRIPTDFESLEYDLSSGSNRFLLILLLESLDYITSETLSMERNITLFQAGVEEANRVSTSSNPKHVILSKIPKYLQASHDTLLNLLQDNSFACTEENFWVLHHALYLYHACRNVCEESVKSTLDFQLMLFIIHFYKLKKWTLRLVEDEGRLPTVLKECWEVLERCFGNTPLRKFRSKFVKKFGHPSGFFSETAAQLYCNVDETFQLFNMTSRLNSPKTGIEHLHIIAANRQSWMEILTKAALSSIYGVFLDRSAFVQDLSSVKDIKLQICDAELVDTEEDDEIMELCKTPAKRSDISDAELISQIQILPLWDYIFLLYESEILCQAGKEIEKHLNEDNFIVKADISEDVLYKIGCDILGINPLHLAHFIGLQQYESKRTYPFCVINFLRHARDGFSSSGLKALYFQAPQNKAELTKWDMNYTSAKQAPLLVYICSSVFGKASNSSLNCHVSLGSYTDKIKQLKIIENILWKNFERLSSEKSSFRHCTSAIIQSWFNSLISVIAVMKGEYPSDRLLTREGFYEFLERSDISSLYSAGQYNVLQLAFENILELKDKGIKTGLQWQVSKCFVLVGLLTYMLLIPRDITDPAIRKEQKVLYLSTELRDLHCERGLFAFVSHVANGETLGTVPMHPYVSSLLNACHEYENQLSAAKEKVLCRSHTDKYGFKSLKEETEQYLTSIGSPEAIIKLFEHLEQAYMNMATDFNRSIASLTQSAENCMKNLQNFSETIVKKFILYKDMTVPFVTGIEQVIYGIGMAMHCVQYKELSLQFPLKDISISEFLVQFSSFNSSNSSDPVHVASLLLDSDNINAFKYLLSFCDSSDTNSGRLLYKLLKSAILEIINEAKLRSDFKRNHLKDRLLALLLTGLNFLWNMWKTEEDKAKIKKEEEEALYVHKTRHHERELTEEEVMEKNVRSMFPSYEKDFAEFIKSDKSDSKHKKTHKLDSIVENADPSFFTHDDMFEVWKFHAVAMGRLFPSEYENIHEDIKFIMKDDKDPDYVTSYLLRQEVVNSIVTAVGDRLDLSVETESVPGLLLMCNTLQKIKENDEKHYYDIYRDPNPSKVINFRSVLENLSVSVQNLLKKYPENPLLVEIFKIVQRVLSFSVTDPVMKFVVGFELILEASQLWEQNACTEVSLKTEIDELTKTIIECRTMELSCWSRGLDCVIRKQYYNSSKWWFLMFPMFSSSIKSTEKGDTEMSVINLLQQCLEDSPLGEFPARLSILFTFLLQYRISDCKDLAEIVYNVYSYYVQFLPSVNSHIAQLRKPIEKEMKDYVKIARWNDLNFYSVKQSVEKSHRYIIKHIKMFEDALKKPAKNFFTLPSKINESESSPWSLDIKPEDFMSSEAKLPKLVAEREETLFKKLPMYHKKAKKLCERVSNNFPIIDHINRLNDLCGNIIEALQSVTSDAVKTVLTRSREKKQTLLNIQTKRQMLSTLFKNLRVMGLSFRQGIIYQKQVKFNEVFCIPAFDPLSLQVLEIDLQFKELLLKSSSDTSHYFYKNIAQYAQLQKFMESPCQDLTLDMIHRIQGYSGHLMQFIALQRQKIVKISKDVDVVGCFLTTLSTFYKEHQTSGAKKNVTVLPPQNIMLQWEGLLCNYLVQFIVSVGQFRGLMEVAASSTEMSLDLSVFSSPFSSNKLSSVDKKNSIWSGISTAYDHCTTDIKKQLVLLSDMLNAAHEYGTWHQFSWVGECFTSTQSAARQVMAVVEGTGYDAGNCFTKNLSSLYSKICQEANNVAESCAAIIQEAEASTARTDNEENRILSRLCQKLAKEVLLAFQDMVKLCLQSNAGNQAEDIDVVSENLFTVRITASIDEIERCLRIENIKQIVNELKKHIGLFQNSIQDLKSIDDSLRLLVNLAPFLNQYYHLLKVYMAVILGMHRTSNKLLSILLEIFIILATKGFCIPPDLQEEAQKYGATKFEDIEGGGLGEGEGMKDVSGNIETEDQLEDAVQEGQEKKESDQKSEEIKEEKEGIEMSNDFEGKTHNPDEQDEETEKSEDEEDLEKKMGDVDTSDAEKLDEKIWGSDSEDNDGDEDEKDLKEESGSGGVTEKRESELVAKDGEHKDDDYEKHKDKKAEEFCPETQDEYKEDIPDPLIDTVPQQEPEGLDLPDNMEIKDDYKENEDLEETEGDTNMEDVNDDGDTENDKDSNAENEEEETEEENNNPTDNVESKDDIEGCDSVEPAQEKEEMEIASDEYAEPAEENEKMEIASDEHDMLPTHAPTSEEAIASADNVKNSSHDPVQCKETPMEWESGAQDVKEQHREGRADSNVSQSEDVGHEGKKSSAPVKKTGEDQQQELKLKQPDENRVVDDSSTDKNVKHKPIAEKQSLENSLGPDPEASADIYEHVSKKEEGVSQAVDIATEEQAAARPVQDQSEPASNKEEVIELSSSDEEEECSRAQGDSLRSDQRQKPGEKGEIGERDEKTEIIEGEVVRTLTVPRGLESTIHTQTDLWRHLSSINEQELRLKMEKDLNLFCHAGKEQTISSGQLWRNYEILVSGLAQELCEQLRLVLEPTKMSKLKGDYRTGKRLNMRKIIPYIASEFRKDKIWLRRTKPSKRQYQIMLAVDDSSSMADNHSKQLAFESLAVLGQSLSLLEAGEISVVSFGEKVELLLGFNEQFSSITGSRIIEQFSFSQKRTNYSHMLNYATDAFVQARSYSKFTAVSKEIAQLLIIISDGRGIYREGEKVMKNAVRRAKDNNIFMVFIVLDSPSNEHSILDIKCPVFEADQLKEMKCYMENFPFPFYIILRDISSLPLVLGEALRQWFELVTSVER